MDEMKIKLSTKFMRGIIAKIVKKTIFKKLGYDIDILINEIEVENIDGKVHLHINADGEISNNEFVKIIKGIGLD